MAHAGDVVYRTAMKSKDGTWHADETLLNANEARLVPIRDAWNAWRTAEVRLGDLQEVHWFQPVGAPQRLLHAYVLCSTFVSGDIPHDCNRAGRMPHRLRVCILRKCATPSVYRELARRAQEGEARAIDEPSRPALNTTA